MKKHQKTQIIKIGKLTFNLGASLGSGPKGSVYEGTYEDRKVAVKVYDGENYTFEESEKMTIHHFDTHKNIIKYYGSEENDVYTCVAQELCVASLEKYVDPQQKFDYLRTGLSKLEVLRNTTDGVIYIHKTAIKNNNLIHRNLRPSNILIADKHGELNIRVSDFVIAVWIGEADSSEVYNEIMTEVERRSKQFWAPESLLSRRYGKSSDIFCLGAIFYYVLTDGKYPFTINKVVEDFGDEKINKYFLHEDMSHIFKLDETADKYLGIDLISEMVQNDRRSRPQSVEVPKHPFLWTLLEKRTFVLKFYENLEKKKDQIIDILNINSEHIIQNDWINPLEVPLKNDVTVKKNGVCNYNKEIIWHLIRFMRNKASHFKADSALSAVYGTTDEDFITYWLQKFPKLLLHIYLVARSCPQLFTDDEFNKKYLDFNKAYESTAAIEITIDASIEDFNFNTFFCKENCSKLYIKNLTYLEKCIPSSFFKLLMLNCKNLNTLNFIDCKIQSHFLLESLKAISNLETLVFEKVHVLNDPMDNLPVEKLTTLGKALKEMIDFNADPKNVMLGFKGKETYFLNLNDNTVKHSI